MGAPSKSVAARQQASADEAPANETAVRTPRASRPGKATPVSKRVGATLAGEWSLPPVNARVPSKAKAAVKAKTTVKAKTVASAKASLKARMPERAARAEPGLPRPVSAPAKNPKLVRDSFIFPAVDFAQLGALKQRAQKLGVAVKNGHLLRAGLAALATLADATLLAALPPSCQRAPAPAPDMKPAAAAAKVRRRS